MFTRPSQIFLGVVVTFCFAVIIGQPAANAKPGAPTDTAPVCMVKSGQDGDQLSILVPASDIAAMTAKSFIETQCATAFPSQTERTAWRNQICELAALPMEQVQAGYEARWGVRPQTLCGMAEVATSQWVRENE